VSNHLAIATVTATLSEWVRPAVETDVDGTGVSIGRPDGIETLEDGGVNFFLYQATPNPAYRNADLPTRRTDGNVVQRPQAAIDLYYLLSFYGSESDLVPQRVMGSVVRTLHARPVLSRQAIEDTIASATFNYLVDSDLAEQIEPVKITPVPLSLEDLSKLWSMFVQPPYRLSTAYVANLVLIEAEEEIPRPSLPVRRCNVYVRPFREPVIEELTAAVPPAEQITSASTLVISGRKLRGEITQVLIGEAEYSPLRANLSDTRIALDLSTETPAGGSLRAGVQPLQVVHRLEMGTPPSEHSGVESDVAALMLRPRIRDTGGVYNIQVSAVHNDPDGNPSFREISVQVLPDVGRRQRAALLMNEYGVDADPEAYRFPAEPRSSDGDSLVFRIPHDMSGEFLFRVQVDGAQSPLVLDEDDTSPTYHQYIQPRRSIP
jgi:hypothetical protein